MIKNFYFQNKIRVYLKIQRYKIRMRATTLKFKIKLKSNHKHLIM
jgi:hypothetical protein